MAGGHDLPIFNFINIAQKLRKHHLDCSWQCFLKSCDLTIFFARYFRLPKSIPTRVRPGSGRTYNNIG